MAVSEAKKKANNKWVEANYKRVNLALTHEEIALLDDYCTKHNLSRNAFFKIAMVEKLERDS